MINELKYCINRSVEINRVERNTVVLDESFTKAHILDPVATDVLQVFSEGCTIPEAFGKIQEVYQNVEKKEFLDFVNQLIGVEILVEYEK